MPVIDPPSAKELEALMGAEAYAAWQAANAFITQNYEMETLWLPGRKEYVYEFKYRRGGKTLCALYPQKGAFGFMVILGKAEREKFDAMRGEFSAETLALHDEATVYHDGLWLMLPVSDGRFATDMEKLLLIKRKPNRKPA